MKVGLIGAGRQGWRRARAAERVPGTELAIIADVDSKAAKLLAKEMGCEATANWKDVVERNDLEAVIITTPNHLHAQMCINAMRRGKHVLCEKPLARNLKEAKRIIDAARNSSVKLKCGFNLRHHPGMQQARQWFDKGAIGQLMFLRCRYGMCGRPGYEKEWRAKGRFSGGGELLDQGVHVLDLFRWFAGDFSQVVGFKTTAFWDIAPLEDNAFGLLRTRGGQIASLHVSWTQWKNLFTFEIFGKKGYVVVEGLGGSYGVERATMGKRSFVEPFREESIDFRGEDRSWVDEWKEFVTAVKENREPLGNGIDGLESQRLVHALYQSAKKGRMILVSKKLR
jgi:predicted dehydrogenase